MKQHGRYRVPGNLPILPICNPSRHYWKSKMRENTLTRLHSSSYVDVPKQINSGLPLFSFFAGHIIFALVIQLQPALALPTAQVLFIGGLLFAMLSRNKESVAWIALYLASTEVFWRMTKGTIVWEETKYVLNAMFILYMLRVKVTK